MTQLGLKKAWSETKWRILCVIFHAGNAGLSLRNEVEESTQSRPEL